MTSGVPPSDERGAASDGAGGPDGVGGPGADGVAARDGLAEGSPDGVALAEGNACAVTVTAGRSNVQPSRSSFGIAFLSAAMV
jgi:hypothetical protein